MTPIALAVGLAFAVLGAASERLASVWPPDEAGGRPLSLRTALYGLVTGLAGGAVVWRSTLPAWATAAYLVLLAPMVVLSATDLEQRRLPHIVLDPLIVAAILFVPFNPAVKPVDAAIGAALAIGFLGLTGLLIRGGIALGDIYLVGPIGLILGWPTIFTAVFVGALLSAVVGLGLLLTRRAGLRTYIPFGPFLVGGLVTALLIDPSLLGSTAALILA
ncbi:MAG: A24 family peptidase [Chloroflexota bacterium]|nr:A24 family peptidase [Chloroflexota bacterium]